MDIQSQTSNDDQELAMALASISQDNSTLVDADKAPTETAFSDNSTSTEAPASDYIATPTIETPTDSKTLEGIRKDALTELRPLVDKLDINAEEKFDICLLLLRSTDDKTLIPTAHEAAKNIADESKRAQALLDVIREIDFLSTPDAN